MKVVRCSCLFVLLLLAPPVVKGQEAANDVSSDYPEEMVFTAFQPCRGSASFCAPQILARGLIDDGAAERLAAELGKRRYQTTIAFDSPGGSLKAGLAMGRLIRERGIDTRVASEYVEEVLTKSGMDSEIKLVAKGVGCFSACAYAFMGGVSRTLEQGGKIGVHQFYGAKENGESVAQKTTALISQYMLSMGVDRELQDVAGLTDSSGMTVIPLADAVRYNLDNQHPILASWGLKAMDGGETAVLVEQQQGGGDRVTRIVIGRFSGRDDVLLVGVAYGPVADVESAEVNKNLASMSSRPTFCVGYEHCVTLVPTESWTYRPSGKVFQGMFLMEAVPFARLVPKEGVFEFNADLPNVYSGYEADVELGRDGLKNALMALYK